MFRLKNVGISTMAVGSATAVLALVGAPAAQAGVPVSDATSAAVNSEASMDWSGWDATAGSYSSVAAAWTVPTVTCTTGETSYSADWVGLDGDGSEAVEQIGTSSDCDSGTPAYSAWYEFYPAVSVNLPNRVRAGDRMTSSVTAVPDSDEFTVKLTDTTAKWTVSKTEESPEGSGASAEIIAEAPSGSDRGDSVLPLADFKKVTFTGVTVDGRPIGSVDGARSIAMVDSSGAPMATVSDSSASSFAVTWVSSGAGAAADSTAGDGRGDSSGGYSGGGYSSGGYSGGGSTSGGSTGSWSTGGGWGSGGWSSTGGYGTGGYGSGGYSDTGGSSSGGYGNWGDAAGWGDSYWGY